MAATTTIRLPDELKARIAAAAKRRGTTPHAFILEAIAEKAEREERYEAFHDEADDRYAEIVASGKAVSWTDMRRYLEQRVAGGKARRPTPKRLAR